MTQNLENHLEETIDKSRDLDQLRKEIKTRIGRLQAAANHGLWALALFIALSTCALWDFSFFPSIPDEFQSMLGKPPSFNMISGALVLYSFSAIILTLSRMMGGSGEGSPFPHVLYLAAFYGFYHFAKGLDDNFWAVFAAGLTVLGLESYRIWTYSNDEIRKEQERLVELERKRAFWSGGEPR